MARTNYNKNFESASAVTKDVFAKPVADASGNVVQLGDGEIVLVTKEGEEGIYGYNHRTDKPVQFNSTSVIRMSSEYNGDIINSGDTLNEAFNKVEGAIAVVSGVSEDLDTIKESIGLDADGKHIPSTGHFTSEASTVEGEINALDNALYKAKVKSSDETVVVTEGEDGTDIKVNLDGVTLVKEDGVISTNLSIRQLESPTSPDYAASYALGTLDNRGNWTILPNSAAINLAKDLVVTKGTVIVVDDTHPVEGLEKGTYIKLTIANQTEPVYINCKALVDDSLDRTIYSGNVATYSEVEVGKTYDSTGAAIKIVTVKNVIKPIDKATEENDGLASAYDVQQYVTKEIDGDVIYVGDKNLPPYKEVGRVNDDSTSEDYDTVHSGIMKLDGDVERIGEAIGIPTSGNNIFFYPMDEVANMNYISGSSNVMEAIYDLASGLTEEKANIRKDLEEFSAKTVDALVELSGHTVSALTMNAVHSSGESITVATPTMEDGTNIEVNIHTPATEAVSKTDPEVVATDKNFLEQDTASDKGLKVTGMDTDVTVTTKTIKILGWANQVGGGVYANWDGTDKTEGDTGINTIPVGSSVQEILENLLSRVLYPNAATKPSISVKLGASLSGYKEVGSTVSVPAASVSKSAGKFNASYTNVSQPTPSVTWSNTSIVTSKTGFTDYSISTSETIAAANSKVDFGENKVSYAGTSTYSEPANSPVRNDNEATTKTGKTAADKTATWESAATTASTAVTVTGVYATYTNGVAGQVRNLANPVAGNGTKLDVTKTYVGATFYVGFAQQTSDAGVAQPYTMFVPVNYGIKSAYAYNGLTGKYDVNVLSSFENVGATERTDAAGNTYDCTIYAWGGTAGANDVQFVLSLAK